MAEIATRMITVSEKHGVKLTDADLDQIADHLDAADEKIIALVHSILPARFAGMLSVRIVD